MSDGSDDRAPDEGLDELEGQEPARPPNQVTPFPGDMPVDPPSEPPLERGPVPE
jgi:hypothetical protein